jgi:hypothetical protein
MPFPNQSDVEIALLQVLHDSGGSEKPRDIYPKLRSRAVRAALGVTEFRHVSLLIRRRPNVTSGSFPSPSVPSSPCCRPT